MRSLSVLSKILGLTASSNPHEAKAAEEKLENLNKLNKKEKFL